MVAALRILCKDAELTLRSSAVALMSFLCLRVRAEHNVVAPDQTATVVHIEFAVPLADHHARVRILDRDRTGFLTVTLESDLDRVSRKFSVSEPVGPLNDRC